MTVLVGSLDQDVDDDERIDRVRALEVLRSAVAAAQAVETAAFVASQRAEQARMGVPVERVGRGIAAQIGLARRISPFEASRYVGQAVILTRELPATFARLRAGEVSEWRTVIVARQTAWLSAADRASVDIEIAPELDCLGTRRLTDRVTALAYRHDPHGYLNRLADAEADRHVTLRPAPDCMARLTALLPVKAGVAAYAALCHAADTSVGIGDEPRTRGQVMADTLTECLTGHTRASKVPVAVNLIMTDQALLRLGDGAGEPAVVLDAGGSVIPAELARRWITDPTGDTEVFLRRLYTRPSDGHLAAMDSSARLFTANQRHFLIVRDQRCRTPWCDAPIRHIDHVIPHAEGGPTTATNGAGLCQACNHAKQAPGWHQEAGTDDEIITITPTRHTYRSRPPDPPGTIAA
jgi:hypothetical protein